MVFTDVKTDPARCKSIFHVLYSIFFQKLQYGTECTFVASIFYQEDTECYADGRWLKSWPTANIDVT